MSKEKVKYLKHLPFYNTLYPWQKQILKEMIKNKDIYPVFPRQSGRLLALEMMWAIRDNSAPKSQKSHFQKLPADRYF